MYYMVTCKDNGCGIPAENIANMLGRVLTGSKHGVRQTRGKFGLGAKMALIWSKKSSGLPIKITTAHAISAHKTPTDITTVVLDIYIYKNEPKVISKKTISNHDHWRGAEITVTIAGNWAAYRSRVLQYFQQLAVITPYADLTLEFDCPRDEKKSFRAHFERRSKQLPPLSSEILPHPKSLNNITLGNLLKETKSSTLSKFLSSDLNGISSAVANKITKDMNIDSYAPNSLSSSQIAALCQVLRDNEQIKPPMSSCLSPAGEYNIRLGVLKEMKPRLVATYTDKAGSQEGHPFIVEAAVSIGGPHLREGINVYRFANRIPLLFETGADVVTQVSSKRVNWNSYHIDQKKDNVGVFVSIVSTKIPFKGTSKEYIGDDVIELQQSVKRAILGCCQQLRVTLAKNISMKEEQDRRKNLIKYIPDISRALHIVLTKVSEKKEKEKGDALVLATPALKETASTMDISGIKRSRLLKDVIDDVVNEDSLAVKLKQAVEKFEADTMLQSASNNKDIKGDRIKLFLTPQVILNFPFNDTSSKTDKNDDDDDVICIDVEPPNKKFKTHDNTKWLTIKGLNGQGLISYIKK